MHIRLQPVFIPPASTVEELRQSLISQFQRVQANVASALLANDFDGKRLTNVGDPQQPNDAVTLGWVQRIINPQLPPPQGAPPSKIVTSGTTTTSQAGLAGLTSSIPVGQLVWVSDFAHMLQWAGTGWQRGPGDLDHSDSFHEFGAAPTDTGWHVCDGATVTYLQYNGTLGTRVLPNLTTSAYAKSTQATYTPGLSMPIVPTISGHTESASTGASVSTSGGSFITSVSGTGVTSTSDTALTGASLSDPTHSHTLLAADAPISLAGGDPIANFSVIKYYRR